MTRYDWSKLDAGWSVSDDGDRLMYGNCASIRIGPTDSYEEHPTGEFAWIITGAKAQLAKCRIRDTEPAPSDDRTTPTNAELMAKLERMQADVEAMRAELAEMRRPEPDISDWREEVRQACEGMGIAVPYLMNPGEMRLRSEWRAADFCLAVFQNRQVMLIDSVQSLEWVLKLSIIITRLQKLGWKVAE